MPSSAPETTYLILLVVQALHLLHHRLAKRHIGFTEVAGAAVLCVPLAAVPAWLAMTAPLGMSAVQIVGTVWIKRLSPAWDKAPA